MPPLVDLSVIIAPLRANNGETTDWRNTLQKGSLIEHCAFYSPSRLKSDNERGNLSEALNAKSAPQGANVLLLV